MSQLLPTGGFRWVSIDPNEAGELVRHDKGYLLEDNVKNPRDLHNSHNNLPFMCDIELQEIGRDTSRRIEKLNQKFEGKNLPMRPRPG